MQKKDILSDVLFAGADDEARTRYLHLGKVALYRMSYVRVFSCAVCEKCKRSAGDPRPVLEVPPRFELGVEVLQTSALPLGYGTEVERTTRLELATSTLARWRSTG